MTLPFVTGSIGLLGTEPSWKMMQECDTLLMVGSGFPYAEFLPKEGQARGVQIDRDPSMLSLRFPMEVNLAGRCRRHAAGAAAAAGEEDPIPLARAHRRLDGKLVEAAGEAGNGQGRPDQSTAGVLGAFAPPAG
jgi:thiamine pyrophosphate-dependent acetolactate synthase large subunit-like protein